MGDINVLKLTNRLKRITKTAHTSELSILKASSDLDKLIMDFFRKTGKEESGRRC